MAAPLRPSLLRQAAVALRRGVLVGALVVGAAGCGSVRQVACLPSNDAVLTMDDLFAGDAPSKLKATTEAPRKTAIDYTVSDRKRTGDLYQSGTPSAAIVLVPGASTSGKDDPRLIAFAEALARMHFTVLVPDLPNVRELRVKPDDARVIADGFAYIATRPDLAPQGRIGMGAFSYALGPTIMAALEPDVKAKCRFVLGVGGYYNLTNTITYFMTGNYKESPSGPWLYLQPNWYGKWVFVHSNVDRFSDPDDRATLTDMANQKVKDPNVDVTALAGKLKSAEGQALYAMLTNTDPEKVPGLLGQLPADVRKDLDQLDLSKRDLTGLPARVLLFHGYDDNLVPYTESIALAGAVRDAKYWLINGFVHVDFAKTGFMDGWRMGCAVDDLLAERWR